MRHHSIDVPVIGCIVCWTGQLWGIQIGIASGLPFCDYGPIREDVAEGLHFCCSRAEQQRKHCGCGLFHLESLVKVILGLAGKLERR